MSPAIAMPSAKTTAFAEIIGVSLTSSAARRHGAGEGAGPERRSDESPGEAATEFERSASVSGNAHERESLVGRVAVCLQGSQPRS